MSLEDSSESKKGKDTSCRHQNFKNTPGLKALVYSIVLPMSLDMGNMLKAPYYG